MPLPHSTLCLDGSTLLAQRVRALREPRKPLADRWRQPWLKAVGFLMMAYIVSSQALMGFGPFSVLGFGSAVVLAGLLVVGRFFGLWTQDIGGWIWFPIVFVVYCAIRSFSGIRHTNPLDVLSAVFSAYLGGIGVAAAMQAGVPFRKVVLAQMISGLCQIGAGAVGIGTEPTITGEEVRYAGLTGNANEFGLQLTLGACLIWLVPKQAGLSGCLFAFGAVVYALVTSGSRQALLVGCLFVGLVIIQLWPELKKRRVILSVACVGLLAASALLGPILVERGRDIPAVRRALEYHSDSSYRKRVTLIQQGLRLWRGSPLLGNGLDSFRGLSGQGTYAHNDYVELLSDLGLIGLLLFYAMHVKILIGANRLPGALRLSCWVLIGLLMLLDTGSVGYKRKQTVVLLMVLVSLTRKLPAVELPETFDLRRVRTPIPSLGSREFKQPADALSRRSNDSTKEWIG